MMHDAFSLRGLAAGCALLFLVAPAVQAAEQLPDAPSIDARAWILMDYASGKVLSEGNADEKLDPASLTKIMTSYVVGQALKANKIKLTDITPDLYHMLQKFAPFGPNNTIPVFMTEKVTNFIGTKRVGRNNEHLKLVIVDDTRACNDRSGIGFGMGHLYDKVNSGGFFDICYTLQENEFMGKNDIQMIVKDIRLREE